MSSSARSRLKIASQSSQSSTLSTPVNLTPATHKRNSHLFVDSPLNSPLLSSIENDDRSEKKRRLQARLSDVAQKHLSSPATESRNKSSMSNLTGWNASQITEHLHNCIQLSRENKINVRNAFSLHLIDSMKDIIRKEKETNFQMAGSSIEAGAKIYAHRVDALHIQAIQVLDQVSQLDKDGDKANDNRNQDDDCSQGEDGQPKKKAVKKKKKIIETDLRKINISNVEQMHEIDPLLQKLSKEGDSSFGGLLLDSLKCASDVGGLMLDMLSNTDVPEHYKPHDTATPIPEQDFLEIALSDQLICPTFHQYEFNNSSKHPIFAALNSRDDELRFDPDEDVAAYNQDYDDVGGGAADNSVDAGADNDVMNGGDGAGGPEFVDYFGKTSSNGLGVTSCIMDGTCNTLVSLVSGQGGEYSFFGNMKNMWAGPSHWKMKKLPQPGAKRPGGDNTEIRPKKSASEKVQLVIDFDADIDFTKKFKKTRSATTVTKQTLERYKKQSLTLPEDLNYQSKQLLALFSRPEVFMVLQKANEALDHDDNAAEYNYFNKNDVDNFCPNISGVTGEDNDHDDYQMSVLSTQPAMLDFDDTLIAQPNLVERINLQYAKRPKKVDFKRLKRNMWVIITEPTNDKENIDQNSDVDQASLCVKKDGVSFCEMYGKLPAFCPTHEAKDLSPPIAFVALLHMSNEKSVFDLSASLPAGLPYKEFYRDICHDNPRLENLRLEAAASFVDLQIFAGEK